MYTHVSLEERDEHVQTRLDLTASGGAWYLSHMQHPEDLKELITRKRTPEKGEIERCELTSTLSCPTVVPSPFV